VAELQATVVRWLHDEVGRTACVYNLATEPLPGKKRLPVDWAADDFQTSKDALHNRQVYAGFGVLWGEVKAGQ